MQTPTYPNGIGDDNACEDGHDEERIRRRQVGEPKGAARLKRGDGERSHGPHQAEHANAERELDQVDEVLPWLVAGGVVHEADLGAHLGAGKMVAGHEGALQLLVQRGVAGILLQLLQLLCVFRGIHGRLEEGDPDADGQEPDGGPPRETGVDVDVLEHRLHERGRAPAKVETERFQEADLLGDIEEVAPCQADRGCRDIGESRGVSGGGSGRGARRLSRGTAAPAEREDGLLGCCRENSGTHYPPGWQ